MKMSYFDNNTGVQGIVQYYAQIRPNEVAVIFEDKHLTYKELEEKSSALAWFLQQQDVGVGDFVILYLERSLDLIISIIAIQKAGAAYVPIDFDYPEERLAFMIADAGAKAILTQEAHQSNLPSTNATIIELDVQWPTIIHQASTKHYQDTTSRTDLAYMIYTSGSTGKPKGVMITHENIFNQLEGQHTIAPTPIDKMLLTCSISFDVSVLTIYWTFYHGATLVIPVQGEEKDIQQLSQTIARHQISHLLTLPTLHTLLLDQADPSKLQSLKLVNVSGEVCPTSLAQQHEALLPDCQLYNLYGPTEATVNCTYFTFPKGFNANKAPIGRPLPNYELFILNDQMEELGIDEVGTIYIGGSKSVVGKGYRNRPTLTAQRFIKNPFQHNRGGEVLYDTGDLGKWKKDGNIEFVGRSDFQVKFRGFRIELGEIEVAISRYDLIKEVVVLLKNKEEVGQQRLVAYVSLNTGDQLNVSDIRAFLETTLPEYMLPTNFVILSKFPLTPNGKFDRNALPDPAKDRPKLSQEYQAPKTPLEKRITTIWAQLLDIDYIGRNDPFFELGGNSIQAAQFIGTIQRSLKTSIFVTTIFDFPTVASYAQMLEDRYVIELAASPLVKATTSVEEQISKVSDTFKGVQDFSESITTATSYFSTLSNFDNSPEKNPPAIFILAPPRSGTSLLRLMLAGHPKLLAVNELKLLGFHTLKERNAAYTGKFSLWQEGAIRVVMELKNCDADAARLIIDDFEKKGYTTKQFYKQLQAWAGERIIVDKTPSYALDIKALQKAEQDFDNAIFIHLVRHPAAMVPSFEKYRMDQVVYVKDHPFSAKALGEMIWYKSHQNIATFLKEIPRHRKFELRYEDLVQVPERWMRSLCEQIQLEFHPNLLRPYENIENKLVDGIHKASRSMSDSNLRQQKTINAEKANDWKKNIKSSNLSDATIQLAEELGYQNPIHSTPPTTTNKASTASQKLEAYAIVGMSCRLPGADTLSAFWHNLITGTDVGKVVTTEDIERAGLDPALLNNPNYVARSYCLDQADCFDASFFGYHPKEAKQMDPQHRILLETAYSCLENAGYNPYTYKGKIGIFGGIARNAYFTNNLATYPDRLAEAGEYADTIGTEKSFSITRVAYKLNLKGPAINVQTACSSSGTAVHLACQSLAAGDADMVLVAGGRIQPPLNAGYVYTDGGPLSPEGYIRAFDADAKGMVKGNGMACIVLKRLEKAVEDKDHIWAVIKGTAINNDGFEKIGFTAPSIRGQADVVAQALEKAGVHPDDIGYIEAHGTGTVLGDPIEVAGLTEAFSRHTTNKQFCGIGSVKTAIGHLDAGACVAGIIKTALALKNEAIPPSLNYQQPNPQINFAATPFYVNASLKEWKRGARIRRAGVSSFGLGGTNVHVVLEEAPVGNATTNTTPLPKNEGTDLVVLSAKTEVALTEMVTTYQKYLASNTAFTTKEIAYTAAVGRPEFSFRKVLSLNKDLEKKGKIITKNKGQLQDTTEIVWMFPGGGAQYVGMAQDLYNSYSKFKEVVDDCIGFLKETEGIDIAPLLFPDATANTDQLQLQLEKPSYALASLFTIEYALAQLWLHWGIRPTQMIGHSMGEYTAACIAGVFSKEDGLRLVTLRGRLFEQLKTEGAMLSVAMSEKEASKYLLENSSISVINKIDNCVISGTVSAIDRIQKTIEAAGIDCARIHIKVAAHSAQIDPVIPQFEQFLQTIQFKSPTIPIISNLTGQWVVGEEITSTQYWVKHLRNTVRFSDGLATILKESNKVLIEIGPGQTLSAFVKQHAAKGNTHLVFPSIRHPKEKINDQVFLQKTLAQLWVNGLSINWGNYYKQEATARVPLPTYPFERTSYWIAPNKKKEIEIANVPSTLNALDNSTKETTVFESSIIDASTTAINTTTMSTAKRQTILIKEIKNILYELSGLEPAEMDMDATFLELGFDSLFLSQAVLQFNNKFDLAISFRSLFETTPTIESLAVYVDEELPAEYFKATESVASVPPSIPSMISGVLETDNGINSIANLANQLPVPATTNPQIADIIQKQLLLMRQQLQLLQGVSPQAAAPINAPSHNAMQQAIGNTSKPVVPKPKKETQEVQIKRATKGVTAKLNNYKKITASDDLSPQQKTALKEFVKRYNLRTQKSKEQAIKHKKYYADPRSVTGFSKLWKEIVYLTAAEKSKGSKIWDVDGNEYIDYVMSYGVALFGHMPDFIEKAIIEQVKKGNSLDVLPPKATAIAKMICEVSGMDRVTLANTGTEAVLAAVRAARTYSGKDRIAVFDTDYHGLVGQFMLRGVHFKNSSKAMPAAPGIPKKVVEDTLVLDYDDPNVLEKLKAEIKDLAALVIEPVQAQNPHWQHHELIRAIRKITAENDVALIFDEIINGFRLALKGAQAWFGVEADLVAYGKSISGGLPMSALAGKEKYMKAFDGGLWQYGDDSRPEASMTYFASTYIKNPISVAAGHAAMSELVRQGPALQEDLNQKTKIFAERVKEIFLRTKAPYMIQATASMYMIKPIDANPLSRLFTYFLRMHGVNMRERPCFISTAHTQEDFDKTYQALELTISDLFKGELIHPYEGEDLNSIYINAPVETSLETRGNQEKTVPLTDGQKEIWVEQRLGDEAATAYNLSNCIKLEGELNEAALKKALDYLVDRHEALRTVYNIETTSQTIYPSIAADWMIVDLKNLSKEEATAHFKAVQLEEVEQKIDLFQGPLFRVKLIRFSPLLNYLILTVHHGIADGWSCGVLLRDLSLAYTAINKQRTVGQKAPPQISGFATQQVQLKASKRYEKAEKYWVEQFQDSIPILEFPTDRKRPKLKTYDASSERILIDAALSASIKKVAAKLGTTPFVFFYTAFQTFLYRLSRQDDFVLGMVSANQSIAGNEELVAHGVNLLPVRIQTNGDLAFSDHIKMVRGKVLDAFDHQNYTLGALVKQLKQARDLSRQPIISILFNMDSESKQTSFGNLVTSVQQIPRSYETFDIFINVIPHDSGYDFELIYNVDLFDKATILLRLEEYKTLLQSIISDPSTSLNELSILPEKEIQLLAQWSDRSTPFPKGECLHEVIEKQVTKTPNRIAVTCEGLELSYKELNEEANHLAHVLMQEGVQKGDFVAVFLDRSIDLLTSLLAIIKAGAIYVPLDPSNPKDRIEGIMNDVGAVLVLTRESMIADLPNKGHKIITLSMLRAVHKNGTVKNLELDCQDSDLVYINYTSGSTGRSKGVLIPHYALLSHHYSIINELNLGEDVVQLGVSSVAFDPSVLDFFMPLMLGGKVVIASKEEVVNGYLLKDRIKQSGANLMQATPSTWRMLLLAGWEGQANMTILSGGEALTKGLSSQLFSKGSRLCNIYGPTETTIWSTLKFIEKEKTPIPHAAGYESIGKPLENVDIYIVDDQLQRVPIGVKGELLIGGVGLAPSGYYKRPALNKKKFIPNPFAPTKMVYRTGDVGRWLLNGEIEFIGRTDNQVKVRGYRIELGEIESILSQHDQVAENVILVREDKIDNKQIVAYVIPAQGHKMDQVLLKNYLKEKLPLYMIPSFFVELEHLPLTATQKIDRNKLPVPDYSKLDLESTFVIPSTDTEKKIEQMWAELLMTKNIGIHDDFFELGGNSIMAIAMMAQLKKEFSTLIPVTILFQNSTIASLSKIIDTEKEAKTTHWKSLIPVKTTGTKPPIYLVHGGGLHVLFYQSLVKNLEENQPVYALQAYGLDGEDEPFDTIEGMASYYIKEIVEQNPEGPYALAGYSLGGVIAFEMAKQLKALNKQVDLLAMFDSVVCPNSAVDDRTTQWKTMLNKAKFNFKLLLKEPVKTAKYKTNVLKMRRLHLDGKVEVLHEDTQVLPGDNPINLAGKKVYEKTIQAFKNYQLEPLAIKVHLFKAKEQMFFLEDLVYYGWDQFALKGVSIHDLPGNHMNMFEGEKGKILANKLQEVLNREVSGK